MKRFLFLLVFVSAASVAHAQGIVQLSTYYPSPFGKYDRIQLVPRAGLTAPPCDPGTMYINSDAGNQLEVCNAAGNAWAPLSAGPWTQIGSDVYVTDTSADVGIGTITPEFKLSLDNDGGILAKGVQGSGAPLTTTGAGTRLMWYPRKAAFRAGGIDSSQWNDANIGDFSVAIGWNTLAGDTASVALGDTVTVNGIGAIALGKNITLPAASDYSLAIGYEITSTALSTGAIGAYLATTADGAAVIGSGVSNAQKLTNNTSNSLAIGFNSTIPTLFIGPSAGAGTTGNVGIGTATPTSRLHVNAPQGDTPPGVFLENADISVDGGADGQFALRNNSASGTRKIFLGGPGAAYILTVDALTAKVGIGTTSPQGGLHIVDFSPGGAVAGLLIERNSQSLGRTPRVVLVDTALGAVTAAPTWNIDNNLDQFRIFRQANISTAGPGVLSINNNGNVGIGTTTPQNKLDVEGGVAVGATYSGTSAAPADGMIVEGNVGIGTADPGTNKLEVAGGPIKATGGLIIETRTSDPAPLVPGQMWLCTDPAPYCDGS